jgi:hypothetical protein
MRIAVTTVHVPEYRKQRGVRHAVNVNLTAFRVHTRDMMEMSMYDTERILAILIRVQPHHFTSLCTAPKLFQPRVGNRPPASHPCESGK